MLRRTLAVLLGAVLGGAPAADAAVNFQRTDIPLSGAPGSVAIGDLDGRNGKDIVVALPAAGGVGVLLNNGDGTFGALQPYLAGPQCLGQAVEVELGDVTGPAGPFAGDGKLDAYLTCSPYVVRLTGDGTGALGGAMAFQLYLPPYLGSATIDFLALVRRPDGNPAPLLALQHSVGSFGRQLCISYELDSEALVCSPTPVEGPLAVGDLNGAFAGVPPDEIFTATRRRHAGHLRLRAAAPDVLREQRADVPGGLESAAVGDLDRDGRLDVLVGQLINSVDARVNSIHAFRMGATELAQVAAPLPSIPGLDAVAIADVDGDGCTDVVGAGGYGRGMIHLGDGAGGFDGGQDLPQLGYQNPSTATRVSMAVGDLTGDGLPEIVIADGSARVRDGVRQPLDRRRWRVFRPADRRHAAAGGLRTRDDEHRRRGRASQPDADTSTRGPAHLPAARDDEASSWARPATTCSSAATAATCSAGAAGTTACSGSAARTS